MVKPKGMTTDDVELIGCETAFKGYFRLDAYHVRHRLFDGGWSGEMRREVFERRHAVAVLPYDPVHDRVVLLEQFRIGAYAALRGDGLVEDPSPWLVECVAGIVEDGEHAEEVARRETEEEVGCTVLELLPAASYYASPGASSESLGLYCGRIDSEGAGGVHGLDHEHEDIRALPLDATEALRWLDEGLIHNATTLIAMQWFALHRDALRERWAES